MPDESSVISDCTPMDNMPPKVLPSCLAMTIWKLFFLRNLYMLSMQRLMTGESPVARIARKCPYPAGNEHIVKYYV